MFYLSRNAESKQPLYWGEDTELTENGKFQAEHYLYGLPWRDVKTVYTSCTNRGVQTGLLAAKESKAKVVSTFLLNPQYLGYLIGTSASIPLACYGYYDKIGGGESLLDLTYRWANFLSEFKPNCSCLVLTHNSMLRAAVLKHDLEAIDWPITLNFKHCKPIIY